MQPIRQIAAAALRDFGATWRTLALTDLACKGIGLAVLTPLTALVLRLLMSRSGSDAISDADVPRYLFTSPMGILVLVGGVIAAVAILFFEAACLMAIGVAAARGERLDVRGALAFGAAHVTGTLRLAARMTLLAIAIVAPFALAFLLIYRGLLGEHDINYYLSQKPPSFWTAGALVAVVAIAFAVVAVRTLTRWAFALQVILFDGVSPREALAESARRTAGMRVRVGVVLGGWAAGAVLLSAIAGGVLEAIVHNATPSGSAAGLIVFLTLVAVLWFAAGFFVTLTNFSLFILLLVRMWIGDAARVPIAARAGTSRVLKWATAVLVVLLGGGFALLAFQVTSRNQQMLVFAHRGASKDAPENTLAAFRAAFAQGADFIELDVQESKDGEVLVVHDSDLMKAGGVPMKIWEHTAAELRSVDIGRGERVPTLAEALELARGKHVLIELKSYGHDQHLEQRVVDLVERAHMAGACIYMSLDQRMVHAMKRLRPSWRVGVTISAAIGDPRLFGADFLAVQKNIATPAFVRRCHRAGQEVYVWTVDDAPSMLTAASRRCDGIITNKPALAREVLERRARMSDAERVAAAMMVR